MSLRPKPEKKEEKERIRHALFRATLHLAAAHGFASLSLREVARETLIAATSFYRHFEDMEELGLALVEEKGGSMFFALAERLRAESSRGDLPQAIAEALFASLAEDPDLMRFLLAERVGGLASFRQAIRALVSRFTENVQEVLEREHPASTRPAAAAHTAADAIVAISLDAASKALDAAPEARPELQARTADQIRMVTLEAGPSAGRSASGHHRKG